MQAVISSAIALNILFGFPLLIGCLLTALDLVTFMLIDFAEVESHHIEWFFISLILMMTISFFWNFSVNPPLPSGILFHLTCQIYFSNFLWNFCSYNGFLDMYPPRCWSYWIYYSSPKFLCS